MNEHYEYELGHATRVPENPGKPASFLTLIVSKQAIQRKKTAVS